MLGVELHALHAASLSCVNVYLHTCLWRERRSSYEASHCEPLYTRKRVKKITKSGRSINAGKYCASHLLHRLLLTSYINPGLYTSAMRLRCNIV